jgi:hypothetical protein
MLMISEYEKMQVFVMDLFVHSSIPKMKSLQYFQILLFLPCLVIPFVVIRDFPNIITGRNGFPILESKFHGNYSHWI